MYHATQRWKVKKGEAIRFCEGWRGVMASMERHFGKIPYRLQRNCDGSWVTETFWPEQKAWREAVDSIYAEQPEGLRLLERTVHDDVGSLFGVEPALSRKAG